MKRKQTAWARFLALLDKWFPREKPRKRICKTCHTQIKRGERWHGKPPHHNKCKPLPVRVPRVAAHILKGQLGGEPDAEQPYINPHTEWGE